MQQTMTTTQCLVSPTHRDAVDNAQPMPSHSDFQATASPMPSHMHAIAKPMQLPHRTIGECQATSALEPTCPTRAVCAHQGSPNNCYGDKHCRLTFLPNAISIVQLRDTIQNATDVGAVGSEDYAKKVGVGGSANKHFAVNFNKL